VCSEYSPWQYPHLLAQYCLAKASNGGLQFDSGICQHVASLSTQSGVNMRGFLGNKLFLLIKHRICPNVIWKQKLVSNNSYVRKVLYTVIQTFFFFEYFIKFLANHTWTLQKWRTTWMPNNTSIIITSMHSSTKLQSPPLSVVFLRSCDKLITIRKNAFFYISGQIVTW